MLARLARSASSSRPTLFQVAECSVALALVVVAEVLTPDSTVWPWALVGVALPFLGWLTYLGAQKAKLKFRTLSDR